MQTRKNTNNLNNIKSEFPVFEKNSNSSKLCYLDSAASAQKPKCVIEKIKATYEKSYANVHRGIYDLSQVATEKYENSRKKVSEFINANSEKEIVFTKGATEGLNLVASSLSKNLLKDDEIIISTLEHHSNIVPWQQACKYSGAKIVEAKPDNKGNITAENILGLISARTKIVSLPHITNSIGSVLPIEEILNSIKNKSIITVIDGCQAAPHIKIDVKKINADFYVFSGHKLYGPSGIGILYGKEDKLNHLDPYQTGGEMIDYVSIEKSTFSEIPHKFEAGTPNIVGAISLGYAIDFVNRIGMKNIKRHSLELTKYALNKLSEVEGIKILGNPDKRIGIISFLIEGCHPHDLAVLLDNRAIAVRAGHHCAQPAMRHFNADTSLRASIGIYNDVEDIDNLVYNLKDVCKYFK